MNSKAPLVLVAICGAIAIGLVVAKDSWSEKATPAVDPEVLARMQERLLDLERGQESLKSGIDEIARTVRGMSQERTTSASQVESPAAPPKPEGDVASARQKATTRGAEGMTVASAMELLLDPKRSWDDREEIWKKIRAAGLLDEVIAEFEKRAGASPKDPNVQTELGIAYLKKIEEVGQGPEAGKWATKADRVFDKALELDPEHWEARFVKAMSLSFWPPVFGKQTEAIKHFETLVGQQERQSPRSGFDDTYLMLGNMYQQIGQRDKAVEVWQRGLKLFPDNAELRQQIANAR